MLVLPVVTWTLSVSATLVAVGIIWTKGIKPTYRFIKKSIEAITQLSIITDTFKDMPNAFKVLNAIQMQFRTDSGSSLRDVVNQIEVNQVEHAGSIHVLVVDSESGKQLFQADREELRKLSLKVDRIASQVETSVDTNIRIEKIATQVARDMESAYKRFEDDTIERTEAARILRLQSSRVEDEVVNHSNKK